MMQVTYQDEENQLHENIYNNFHRDLYNVADYH